MERYENCRQHLLDELRHLDLLLSLRVFHRRNQSNGENFTEFSGVFVSNREIEAIVGNSCNGNSAQPATTIPGPDDQAIQAFTTSARALQQQITVKLSNSLKDRAIFPLEQLVNLYHLTAFDKNTLLLCLAPELDLKYEKLFAYLQNDAARKKPGVDLALQLFCTTREEKLQARKRFGSDAPLIKYHFIRLTGGHQADHVPLLSKSIKLDDRTVDFLLGLESIDKQLSEIVYQPFQDHLENIILPSELKENIINFINGPLSRQNSHSANLAGIMHFYGPAGTGKKTTAGALCREIGRKLLIVDLRQILESDSASTDLCRRLFREANLQSSALYVDGVDLFFKEEVKTNVFRRKFLKELQEFSELIFLGSEKELNFQPLLNRKMIHKFAFTSPGYQDRLQLWYHLLRRENINNLTPPDLEMVAGQFNFTPAKIYNAIKEARQQAIVEKSNDSELSREKLFQACRVQSRTNLGNLANKIEPLYTWDDIVLPGAKERQLKEICVHVKYHQQVFDSWGFDEKVSLGKGLGVLFSGPSGTGKTMAAEVMAKSLGLDLYKIDLSGVVSKYIGETEKNLAKIFLEAQESNAILLFDEADAVFGKRSEVKDAHDRYANIEINYLLQQMEEYEGLVILTTNLRKNMDDAFVRRLRFIVEFPMPDEKHRRQIWEKVFPAKTPLDENINLTFLAQKFKISGGNIKNIALNAAFLAAQNCGTVKMEHIIRTSRQEFQKMGRLNVKADFGQYYYLLKDATPKG